jgi:hypothetical protein
MANNTANYSTTQTFLIECSRADSLIDTKETADYNSKWSNATNFNLKRGDVVSVEAITLSAKNASGAGTIEFSGDKVFIDGTEKDYCDNKVLLEVMFYMNNNNTYSVGLPLNHPEGGFNDVAGNKPMPVYNPTTNQYYSGFPSSFVSDGYMINVVDGNSVEPAVSNAISYVVFAYNVGTSGTPNYVSTVAATPNGTPISSIVLAKAGDPTYTATNKGFLCNDLGLLVGNATVADSNCNVFEGCRMAISHDTTTPLPANFSTQDYTIIPEEVNVVRSQLIQPTTGRIEIVFDSPFQIPAKPLPAQTPIAIVPSAVDGSSEMGNIAYDNLDQTGMGSANRYRRLNTMLNLYSNNIGKAVSGTGAGSQYNLFPATTYGDGSDRRATVAYDHENNKQGYRNGSIRDECDGKPYIWTRNDYFGIGAQKRNGKGFMPKLMPMTAFILLEADELFTDLTTLANKINDKLHEALAPFDNDISIMDNYITNKVDEPVPQFKGSSVVPRVNNYGFYDIQVYNNSSYVWKNIHRATWTDILPVKYGGCTKVQPANFQPGLDLIDQGIGRIQIDLGNYDGWKQNCYLSNPILHNTYGKEGRFANTIYGNMGYKEIYKMMFGDRMMRLPVYDMNATTFAGGGSGGAFRNIGRSVLINTRLTYQFAVSETPPPPTAYLHISNLERFQTLFFNIKFPTYTIDNDGNKVLNYDPELWSDFAEALRDYELYTNKDPNSAGRDYPSQKLDYNGWSCLLDAGITDDQNSVYTSGKTTNHQPLSPNWMSIPPDAASTNTSPDYGTGLNTTAAPTDTQYRELISPAFSQAIFGDGLVDFNWNQLWNAYRGIGRVSMMSRFDPNWKQTSKQFSDIVPGQEDPLVKLIFDDEETTEGVLDIEFIQNLNIGFYPARYVNADGVDLICCGMRVSNDYGKDFTPYDTSTFQLGQLTWGLPMGVSNSFIDNHGIAPMNADMRNVIDPLKSSSGNVEPPALTYIENQTPFVVFGANNPTFQYNPQKNRFEFINLQTDNLLSSLNQAADAPATNPQIGEKCGIINGQQKDAVFNIPNPKTSASSADNYTDTMRNQGIRAEIGGVSIFKVWLCPPDYKTPENINPVNYWNNSTLEKTEENRQEIIKGCIKADEDNWEGCLLDRLGFNVEDLLPRYGRQYNRFSPDTYNNANPNILQNATKPLILNNDLNPVINPAVNLYFTIPAPGSGETPLGVPKFLHGFNENQEVITSLQSLPLQASNSPLLTNSSFFLIYSDIVAERNYQSGSTPLPCVFYAMKNYSNGGFLYAYGSNYNIMVNQDRLLSQINTEIRNPNDGKLAKLSPNSTIIYKIQRTAVVPNPTVDVFGKGSIEQKQPDPNKEELDKIFGEEKKIAARIGGSVPTSSGIRVSGGGGIADRMRLRIKQNVDSHTRSLTGGRTDGGNILGTGDTPNDVDVFMTAEEAKEYVEEYGSQVREIPEGIEERALQLVIQSLLNKLPIGRAVYRGDTRGLLRSIEQLFQTMVSGDINLDMNSYWVEADGDREEFIQSLMEDLIEEVNVGTGGNLLRARERPQELRSPDQGVVYATRRGLDDFVAIIQSYLMGEYDSGEQVIKDIKNTVANGGLLVEIPAGRDQGGRPIGGRGYEIISIDFTGRGRPLTRREESGYNPEEVINEIMGSLEGGGGGGEREVSSGKLPASSESTEQFSSQRMTESRRRGSTDEPGSKTDEPEKPPPPPPQPKKEDEDEK